MRSSCCLSALLLIVLLAFPTTILSQATAAAPDNDGATAGDNDQTSDTNDGGADNDGGSDKGEDSEGGSEGDTSVGANPPDALVGCTSPYTYVEAQSRINLTVFHALIEADQTIKEALKYRNFTGTLLIPTDSAFNAYAKSVGVSVENPGVLDTASLQSLIEYHVLQSTIDPTTLAAASGSTPYNTYLATTATGSNAKLNLPAWQTFAPNPALAYQNVTLTVTPSAATGGGQGAPAGTYSVTGGTTKANIIWDNSHQPTRTCEGYVYLINAVLLPAEGISVLGVGGTATTPIAAAGESEGASVTEG